jgi:hypothetical protein
MAFLGQSPRSGSASSAEISTRESRIARAASAFNFTRTTATEKPRSLIRPIKTSVRTCCGRKPPLSRDNNRYDSVAGRPALNGRCRGQHDQPQSNIGESHHRVAPTRRPRLCANAPQKKLGRRVRRVPTAFLSPTSRWAL